MDASSVRGIDGASPRAPPKRPGSSLLPAFEPASSSPSLPRPLKRGRDALEEKVTYPTPVPTSSTAILSSSPQHNPITRSVLQRTNSALSDRTPLAAVPTIELKPDGSVTRMGRSTASCDYQFSANRLISRVHVEARYKAATSRLERDRVEVLCSGWNGIKIHCKGHMYQLAKGETFSSDVRGADIMVDAQSARVSLKWPPKPRLGPISSDEEEEQSSPQKRQRSMRRHSTPPSPSPLQARRRRPASPVSPSPAVQALLPSSPPVHSNQLSEKVEIYEDPPGDPEVAQDTQRTNQSTQILSQIDAGKSSASLERSLSSAPDFSDNDEENDPIIHSFGPFGANLLPRMQSFNTNASPNPNPNPNASLRNSNSSHTMPLQSNISPSQPASRRTDTAFDVTGHVINQLAFSRLSSTPLSTILHNLPHEAGVMSNGALKAIIMSTRCIGEVAREGKDAAGKALESEYYYIPDEDEDENRKAAVVNDLRKPGLRACRKQHKQYYWRKPK